MRGTGRSLEKLRQKVVEIFKNEKLKITVEHGMEKTDFLDITLDLKTNEIGPYRKPNDNPRYVHAQSNHPPQIIKNFTDNIEKRLNSISSNEKVFNSAKPMYERALKDSKTEAHWSLKAKKTPVLRKELETEK